MVACQQAAACHHCSSSRSGLPSWDDTSASAARTFCSSLHMLTIVQVHGCSSVTRGAAPLQARTTTSTMLAHAAHRLSSERTAEDCLPAAGVTETVGAPTKPYSCTREPSTKAGRSAPAAPGPTLQGRSARQGARRQAVSGQPCGGTACARSIAGRNASTLQLGPAQAPTASHACTVMLVELLMLAARPAALQEAKGCLNESFEYGKCARKGGVACHGTLWLPPLPCRAAIPMLPPLLARFTVHGVHSGCHAIPVNHPISQFSAESVRGSRCACRSNPPPRSHRPTLWPQLMHRLGWAARPLHGQSGAAENRLPPP